MAVYTTVADVAALRARGEFTANTRPTLAEVEVFIDIIASEMEVVMLQNFQLPISEATAPIAYRFLRLTNMLGTAMMVFDSVNATISDPTQREKNTWRKPYQERLKQLGEVNSLPGVELIQIWDYPFSAALVVPDPDGGGGTPDTPLSPSVPVIPTPTNRVKIAWGWSTDDMAQASEFPDVGKSASDHVVIPPLPQGETSAYALLWIADSLGNPTGLTIPMSLSTLGIFGGEAPLQLDGVRGQARVSGFRQTDADVGKTITVSF